MDNNQTVNEEEIQEKRPGRPKKKQTIVDNESREMVTMVKDEELDRQVSTVREPKQENFHLTSEDISKRWTRVFSKYGTLGFDRIYNTWNTVNASSINNPFVQNRRIKQINSPATKISKEEMANAMADPESHEDGLRSVSWGLYYSNYIYQTLLNLNKHTPQYFYYATPLYVDGANKKQVKEESVMVDKILKKFNPKLTFKTIATQVAIEGKCSYLVRTSYNKKDVDFLLLQKLNSNQVKITGFGSKQQFIASFNMAIFLEPGYSIEQYPKYIQDAWENMITNGIIVVDKKGKTKFNPKASLPKGHTLEWTGTSYMYWVQLPQDLCYTFYSDGSHPNAFPDAIGLFTDLNDLDDYRWLQGNLLSKGVNSILTAEVPLVKDPKAGGDSTAISPDTILGYQDFFAENISANIFPFFAPFQDFDLHTLQNQPESMDIIYSRIRDLISSSGNSALLSLSEKPTVASTLAAEKIQASKNDYLTRQFQQFLNEVINRNFELKNTWNVTLHGNIFTFQDEEKVTKELVLQGAKGLIPKLLSYEGLTVEDYIGSEQYLDILGLEIKSNSQILAEERAEREATQEETLLKEQVTIEGTGEVGRPALDDGDIVNDNTEISKSAGNNSSVLK